MPSTLVRLVSAESVRELPMPAFAFGLIALGAFALLLAVTWAFRGTANKYAEPPTAGEHGGEQHH